MSINTNINTEGNFKPETGRSVLYSSLHLTFLRQKNYYILHSTDENSLQKKELINFLRFARKIYKSAPYQKLLVAPGIGSNVDIDCWAMLTKVKFEKANNMKIAFVARGIHQSLLLKSLQGLNKNIQVFQDKTAAVKWLNNTSS
ncbi:MAG: hypothetical protein H0W61_03620 [Bacteroidetes bacterium]|nr:hypothetical protein [Bacteroidota bacterium]